MRFLVVDTVLLLCLTSQAFGVENVNYVPVGCYKDVAADRAMPEMLANYRVQSEQWPDILEWKDLQNSVIKKCAIKAQEKGYRFFGIQFYGECWSGQNSHVTYARYGTSKKCMKSKPFVGKHLANFVYMLTTEDECQVYETLNSADRSKTHTTQPSPAKPLCDHQQFGFQDNHWYRFTGEAGVAMAKECVHPYKCQSYRSGWYNGPYPKVSDGIQNGEVCFSDGKNCCHSKVNVKIRNCAEFYVYKLPSTKSCMYRYCGDGQPGQSGNSGP